MRRTKIVATIGPASDSPHVLDALIDAGLDVARINASHADISELDVRFARIREAAARAGRHVGVMHPCIGYSDERIEIFGFRGSAVRIYTKRYVARLMGRTRLLPNAMLEC